MRKPFVFDMETSDPDNFIALLFLLGHPKVDLRAVTITPGSFEQAELVFRALRWFERGDVAVGVFGSNRLNGSHVSGWHYKTFPELRWIEVEVVLEPGWQVLDRVLNGETTLVCGGPLKNLGELVRKRVARGQAEPSLGTAVIQGGFAGEGVVQTEDQLEKFRGKITCPTFNLNGDIPSALLVLEQSSLFKDLQFVSKNVAHGVIYDDAMRKHAKKVLASRCHHGEPCECSCHRGESGVIVRHFMPCCSPCEFCVGNYARSTRTGGSLDLSQRLIYRGLGSYSGKGVHKKLHDPLAAACAIDPSIGQWAEVELYRTGGEWGSRLSPGSGVQIITGYEPNSFLSVFLGES